MAMLSGSFTDILAEFVELNTLSENSGTDGRYYIVRDTRFH